MSKTKAIKNTQENTVEVLYQKMGDRWYAFSIVDDEVFYGSIQPSDLPQITEPDAPTSGGNRNPSRDA